QSLATGAPDHKLCHRAGQSIEELYANKHDKLDIEFYVDRLPLAAEVLDPRMVRIPPGKCNEHHKHAHETLIHILEGAGRVVIDDRRRRVQAGASVLVPRWAMHQTQNTGASVLRFLAVTDFRLSERAYLGDATDYRMGRDADASRRRL